MRDSLEQGIYRGEAKTTICPNCYQTVEMYHSPGGLLLCPRCGFSPTVKGVISAGMDKAPHNVPMSQPPGCHTNVRAGY